MSATIEARRLSGVDIGKHIEGEDRTSSDTFAGVLEGVSHYVDEYVELRVNSHFEYVHATDLVTITGRKS